MKHGLKILIGILAAATAGQAAFPLYSELAMKYPRYANWDAKLPTVWTGWKTRFLKDGLVQGRDPTSSDVANVSEGQAYGMLLSVWMGDQTTFNSIWSATEGSFWNASCGSFGYYGWKLPFSKGTCGGQGSYAPDADQDIAGALIFASVLYDKGIWKGSNTVNGVTYKDKAKTVLKAIWANMVDKNNHLMISWHDLESQGAIGTVNPAYHSLHWYPVFKEFAAANGLTGMDWDAVATASMGLFNAQPNAKYGMARNFSSSTGGNSSGGTSSIGAQGNNTTDMGYDAIRVPFRIGLAAIWYPKTLPKAVDYAKSVFTYGSSTAGVDVTMPGYYYTTNAKLVGWTENYYEKFMTRAMWGALAVSVRDSSAALQESADQIARDLGRSLSGTDYLSGEELTCSSSLATSPCLNYYAQSLGLLGSIVIAGRAWNVWDDQMNPWVVPDTAAQFLKPLTATPSTIVQNLVTPIDTPTQVSRITATLSKSVPWTLHLKGLSSGAIFDLSGNSTTIDVPWLSRKKTAGTSVVFSAEKVVATLVYPGVDSTKTSYKTTITVTANTGIQPRAELGQGSVLWTRDGLVFQDPLFQAGDRVKVQVRDLAGRLEMENSAQLRSESRGVLLAMPLARTTAVRVIDLTDPTNSIRRRYLVSPNP